MFLPETQNSIECSSSWSASVKSGEGAAGCVVVGVSGGSSEAIAPGLTSGMGLGVGAGIARGVAGLGAAVAELELELDLELERDGNGTTVVSALLKVRSPVRTMRRRLGQCGSGHAISASVVIQSCGDATRCFAASKGSTAPRRRAIVDPINVGMRVH